MMSLLMGLGNGKSLWVWKKGAQSPLKAKAIDAPVDGDGSLLAR